MNVMNKRNPPTIKPVVSAHPGLRLLIGPKYSPQPMPGLVFAPLREIPSLPEGGAPEQGKSFPQASIQKP